MSPDQLRFEKFLLEQSKKRPKAKPPVEYQPTVHPIGCMLSEGLKMFLELQEESRKQIFDMLVKLDHKINTDKKP